ncbi:hypothetical protein PC41400_14680 [Paenibacillus chitinolyticus]|uniref:DUF6429 domain-containing protein n=1 Tax=Paenibacillus chitinolyticus TaxID=79263 RepID=A0A410WWQ9_9BACL|nr:hypothetical protein [Paenibacillus chitinolyticus]MCY9593983.1 hypothetical protein [Paenibacillus chitinolyticus]MCY9599638.1 hypothetical protein [Paenibacillus chitinolyticus]QAV18855.1 hypothetical protein PC41400_14680 [Paenibacillus chitinolyticus]
MDQLIEDLTVVLIHLTASGNESWRGYDTDVLRKLKKENLIGLSNSWQTVYIGENFKNKAIEIINKYQLVPEGKE